MDKRPSTPNSELSAAKRALLAQRLQGKPKRSRPSIPRREPGTPIPLSFAQQRLWFLHQLAPESPAYNIPFALQLQGTLDRGALEQAMAAIADRHEILRTNVVEREGTPQQVVRDRADIPLLRVDLSPLPPERRQAEVRCLADWEGQQPFDLTRDLPIRAMLLELGTSEFVLLVTLHHIASDAWSTGILVRELTAFYRAFLAGKSPSLPPLPIQYGDFALWQRQPQFQQRLQGQLDYWQQQFATLPPVLELPSDRPRPPVPSGRGARIPLALDAELTAALKKLARECQATLFMALLAACDILLYRYTGQRDLTVGAPIANRTQQATEGLIGAFLNTLALRTTVDGDLCFRELLARIRETTLGAYAHQDLPFEQLVDKLKLTRELSHTPLFQVMLILQNAPMAALSWPGLTLTPLELPARSAKFDLTFIFSERDGKLVGGIEYSTDLFDPETVERARSHFLTLLRSMVANPDAPIRELPLLSASEQEQLRAWNRTERDDFPESCLHHLVEAQVERTPEAIAVVYEHQQLTYAELNQRANRLARYLQHLGVAPESVVGVCLERSLDLVVALLAVLKAGGAYLPLDPTLPAQRLAFLVDDAGVETVIALPEAAEHLGPCEPRHWVRPDAPEIEDFAPTNPDSGVLPENLAYVIYTSGSTGKPKGAANTHRGVGNRLHWMQAEYELTGRDRVLQKTPFSFDVSVWEFFWTLMAGARLQVARPGGHKDSDYLIRTIVEGEITTLHFVPSMLRAFLEAPGLEACRSLRQVFCSGEALTADLQARFFARARAQLHNLYGPTEAAIDVTSWACQPDEPASGTVPIGRAIANTQIYLLDGDLNPVAVGVPGELYIGGAGLARGYYGRPGLTADRFIPNPFARSGNSGTRLYRTGDLARYRPDGAIEFLGRLDDCVKIRGFRVELGEIEAVLCQHPLVRAGVVALREDTPGRKRLVAYVVLRSPENGEAAVSQLREWLREQLPDYMLPSAFVTLEALPLNPNGKVDRRALPAPELPASGDQESPPESAIEKQLATIWQELLGVPSVGIDDNFFELGGDSILSLQVVARARRAGLQLTPKQLFERQTIRALAPQVEKNSPTLGHGEPIVGAVPLTPIQRWFFEQPLVERHHWNQALLLKLHQRLSPVQLQAIARYLLNYHDALRLRFVPDGSTWQQEILPPYEAIPCHTVDVSAFPPDRRPVAIAAIADAVQGSLRLEDGRLCRIVLVETGEEQRLLLVVHHLAIDGVSWRILLEDLQALYRQQASGQPLQLLPKTTSFQDWARRLQAYAQELDAEAVSFAPTADFPADFPDGVNTVATSRTLTVSLSPEETTAWQQTAAVARARIEELLLAAIAQACAQWTGRSQVLLDLEAHGREPLGEEIDLSRTVGWFTSLFPVEFDLSDPGVAPLQVVKETLRRLPNRGLDRAVRRYLRDTSGEQYPTPAIRFNYLGQFDFGSTGSGLFSLAPEAVGANQGAANPRTHPLAVDASLSDGQLQLRWSYSTAQYRATTVDAIAENCLQALRSLLSEPPASYIPSDFPLAQLEQATLEHLLREYAPLADIYPLSPTQQGILFHALYAPEPGTYVTQMCYRLRGALNLAALKETWQQVSDRHPVLRTAFDWERAPLQIVRERVSVPWQVYDWRSRSEPQQEAELEQLRAADRQTEFDLNVAPLMRLSVVRLSDDTTEMIWSFHHLILDGWSLPLVFGEAFALYESQCQGTVATLPAAPPYRDYIAWLSRQNQERAAAFWQSLLRGWRAPTLLAPQRQSPSEFALQKLPLTPKTTAQLQTWAQQAHLTLNTLVQGAWALLLAHLSEATEVVFGATTAGRSPDLPGCDRIVGVLINTLPVRVQIAPNESCRSWLQGIQAQQSQARQYEYVALSQIQRWSEIPAGTPLFDSLVVFENYPLDAVLDSSRASLHVERVRSRINNSYPLTVRVVPGAALSLEILSDRACFAPETSERWLHWLAFLLQWLPENPDATVSAWRDRFVALAQEQQQQRAQNLTHSSLQKLQRTRRKAIRPHPPEV